MVEFKIISKLISLISSVIGISVLILYFDVPILYSFLIVYVPSILNFVDGLIQKK